MLTIENIYQKNICNNVSSQILPRRPHAKLDLHTNAEYHVYLAVTLSSSATQVKIFDLLVDATVPDLFTIEIQVSDDESYFVTLNKQNCEQGRQYAGNVADIAFQPLVYWHNGEDTPQYAKFSTFVYEPSGVELDVDWPVQNLNVGSKITGDILLENGSEQSDCATFDTTNITSPGNAEPLELTVKNGGNKGTSETFRRGGQVIQFNVT